MMDVFFDLETRPCDDPDLIPQIIADIRPPGNYKKYETIQEWERTERQLAEANAIAKTSLDGGYGRVCVIGWAIDDAEPQAIVGANERELILAFFSDIEPIIEPLNGNPPLVTWVGHNIAGFDLPFLRKRCYVLGIRPPRQLEAAMRAKAWSDRIGDTMLLWDDRKENRISLDNLCVLLDIPSPKLEGIDGSKVAELFAAGEYERLGDYCRGDVTATRRCYRAMTFA